MEVENGLLYPHLAFLDNVPIDSASYAVVKVTWCMRIQKT
jgi:hypothetical protein